MPRHAWLVGVAIASLPVGAHAANGLRPRTPAVYENVPCIVTVDKSVDPIFHIDYGVPYDDVELTPDELPDSRRMQFFAVRKVRFDYKLPVWITQTDYDRADANADITKDFTDEDILELATLWPSDTWVSITPDDPRLPITMDQAAMGVDWDTTDVPVGTWVIATYTWEPENNLWSYRFGAVKLVDPEDPDSGAPAVFLELDASAIAMVDEPYPVVGCIDAAEGSTFTASYGVLDGIDEPAWVSFVEDEPVQSDALMLDVVPPAEAEGKPIKVRVEVTDPEGRSYVAFSPATIEVLGTTTGGDTSGGDTSGGDTTDDPTVGDSGMADGGEPPASFGCRVGGGLTPWALVVLGLLLARRRMG